MSQSVLFDFDLGDRIVNVASVPQRSPFRYAGGKTWLAPRIRLWLSDYRKRHGGELPAVFAEPFAGGGSASLTVAFEELAASVVMAELDEAVAAVWQVAVGGEAKTLAARIIAFDLTRENVEAELARPPEDRADLAFQTILRNRVNRGGILAPGVGLLKRGENNRGLGSRWYPQTLKRRLEEIHKYRDRITFVHGDGLAIITRYTNRADAVFFLDPPYTTGDGKRAGARLYTHNALDHEELFRRAAALKGDFLMTYDNAPAVHALAARFGFETLPVAMKTAHHAAMTELLIGRDLTWARGGNATFSR